MNPVLETLVGMISSLYSMARIFWPTGGGIVTELENAKPDSAIIILGDFNGASLKSLLPRFKQYITCATRDQNTLDLCYCNMPGAYVASRLPPLGNSDHNMVQLQPSYIQKLKAVKPMSKSVKVWNAENQELVAGSLACTDWSVFIESCHDLDDLTCTVSDYIHFCIDSLVPEKEVKLYPNNKPWITKDLRSKLQAKHCTRKSGDKQALRVAQKELNSAITSCKQEYKAKIEHQFTGGSRACWQGLKTVAGYTKSKNVAGERKDQEWADELNQFYTRFEKPDPLSCFPADTQDGMVAVTQEEVYRSFRAVKANKAPGPDGLKPSLLKQCAEYIAPIFCYVFNRSLQERKVPAMWKDSIIVPVPKKDKPVTTNDYRPVALTSTVMKCFERLVLPKVIIQAADSLDPFQFAYKKARSTDDATATLTHLICEHLDKPGTYVRLLFVDFSSAFNTMLPSVLISKLLDLGVQPSLCAWISDYLHNRTQRVRVGDTLSATAVTNIGAPQGCVLSPALFTLYTNNHVGTQPLTYVTKYADDAAMAGLISGDNESQYRSDIDRFANQCDSDGLELNIGKTKEMIIDFRKGGKLHKPVNIKGSDVAIVTRYDYLGTTISNDLSWTANIERQTSKAMRRMYHLRKLRQFGISTKFLSLFYHSVIESVATFGIVSWGGNIMKKDRKRLDRVRRVGSRLVGQPLTSWENVYRKSVKGLGQKIMGDKTHPLNAWFRTLPSNRRLQMVKARRDRYSRSFVPQAVRELNT